jgi:hypothetical protein
MRYLPLILIFIFACSPQKRATKHYYKAISIDKPTTCELSFDNCRVRDSIIIEKTVTEKIYDTVVLAPLFDFEKKDTVKITDTLKISSQYSTARSWVSNGNLTGYIENKDSALVYGKIILRKINNTAETFMKSYAKCNGLRKENNRLNDRLAWIKIWRTIAFLTVALLVFLIFVISRK